LVKNRKLLNTLRQHLNDVRDLERLITRIDAGRCNGRDLQALATSLVPIPTLREAIGENNQELINQIAADLQALPELVELIERAIAEAPPIGIKDGGIFKTGFNVDLDALRQLAGEGRQWLAKYQAQEQERTGIKTLKVRHNRVFGYYIEVSKGQANAVPQDYERRQTLVNAERFITPELKNYEQSIFGAQDKAIALQQF
jgi:DNA mismatch repair protein MutS